MHRSSACEIRYYCAALDRPSQSQRQTTLPLAVHSFKFADYSFFDSMHPGRQRLVALVSVAFVVHGKQAFLDKVFDFIGPAEQTPAQESAQVRAEFLQERLIRSLFSVEPSQEQSAQLRLDVGWRG